MGKIAEYLEGARMNTILARSHQMGYHTDMRQVFKAIGDQQQNYNWLITNIECNHDPDSRMQYPYSDYVWMSGKEITELVYKHDIQFIWAVFSGFEPHIHLEDILKEPLPSAENPDLWGTHPKVQHSMATLEIVAWDSTLTLLLSKEVSISRSFRRSFPEAKDLDEHIMT